MIRPIKIKESISEIAMESTLGIFLFSKKLTTGNNNTDSKMAKANGTRISCATKMK